MLICGLYKGFLGKFRLEHQERAYKIPGYNRFPASILHAIFYKHFIYKAPGASNVAKNLAHLKAPSLKLDTVKYQKASTEICCIYKDDLIV